MQQALLLVSHGSRSAKANQENRQMAEMLRQKSGLSVVEYAFLEIAEPSIPAGIEACVRQGAGEIFVLINFLNSGRHVTEDIPALVDKARRKYPEIKFNLTPPIGKHSKILDLFLELVDEAKS